MHHNYMQYVLYFHIHVVVSRLQEFTFHYFHKPDISPFVGAFMLYTAQPRAQCKTQLLLVVLQCVKHNMGVARAYLYVEPFLI